MQSNPKEAHATTNNFAQAAHTPGPWEVDDANGIAAVIAFTPEAWVEVARVEHGDREARLADARLISAAPDLLAAAKMSLEYFERCVMSCDDPDSEVPEAVALRAAIAKATGQTAGEPGGGVEVIGRAVEF